MSASLRKGAQLGSVTALAMTLAAPAMPVAAPMANGNLPAKRWMAFDTDACGEIGQIANKLTVLKTSYPPDADDEDNEEDEWTNAWNMSPGDSVILNNWLSKHPDISVITDAVEKDCDDRARVTDEADNLEIA